MKYFDWLTLPLLVLAALPFSAVGQTGLLPLGPELQVNPEHPLFQEGPVTGLALDGTAVILWTGDNHLGKRARWLERQGLAVGDQVSVNPPPDIGFSTESGGAFNSAGVGVTCWQVSGPCLCRRLDTRGSLISEAFRCSDSQLGPIDSEQSPKVAVFDDGSFVAVWRLSYGSNTTFFRVAIQGRFFDAAGNATSPVFDLVRDRFDDDDVSVASLGGRRAVVVWRSPAFDGAGDGIRGQIVAGNGELSGPPFVVNTYVLGDQSHPRVASDGKNRFVVTWQSDGQDGLYNGVYGQLFDGNAMKLGPEFRISSDAISDQLRPEVAMDRLGNFVVAHYSVSEAPWLTEDTFLRAFGPDGAPRGPQVRANEQILYKQNYPSIDFSDAGLVQVAYESWRRTADDPDYNWDIMTRRFVLACEPDSHTLCLGAGGRFQVRAFWKTPAGEQGAGSPLPLTADTGGFYFFSPGNFELLVKVLDACGVNGHYWIFAAGLTDVEVELIVTDTYTGQVQVFENPLGQAFAPLQRVDLLAGCGAAPPGPAATTAATELLLPPAAAAAPAVCSATDPALLCLRGGRFRVRASWRDFRGQAGAATAFPLTDESGLFYFFTAGNLELAVKVLDGCAINGHFWVFAVGLTNVAVDIEVEDTATGQVWRRGTELGESFPPFLDSGAFASCADSP